MYSYYDICSNKQTNLLTVNVNNFRAKLTNKYVKSLNIIWKFKIINLHLRYERYTNSPPRKG